MFKSTGFSVLVKQFKNKFQHGGHCIHLGLLIKTIFSYFWATGSLDTSYQSSRQLVFPFRRNSKQIFKIATMVAILEFSYFWSTSHPNSSNQVLSLLTGSREVQNRLLRWQPWQSSWISNRDNFSYFWSTSHPNTSYPSFESFGLSVQKFKFDFQDGDHLWFLIRTILAIFLSTSHPSYMAAILDFLSQQLCYFSSTSHRILLTKFGINWLPFRRRSGSKQIFKDGGQISDWNYFSYLKNSNKWPCSNTQPSGNRWIFFYIFSWKYQPVTNAHQSI